MSAGKRLDTADLLVDTCDLSMYFFFFVKMLRRYTLPGKRKSPVERASSVGCNYGSIIANSVH
jgi:hypothetical protein